MKKISVVKKLCRCKCGSFTKWSKDKNEYNDYIYRHSYNKGRKMSATQKKKISIANMGKTISEETRKRLSESHKGYIPTKEARRKMSLAISGKNHPMYGKTHTKEAKEKIRLAGLGRKMSMEQKLKVSEFHKGKILSFETKKKMSLAKKGRLFTEEHKKKLSAWIRPKEMRLKISKSRKGKCKGNKNSSWLGGISFEPYGIDFNDKVKELVRRRDNYTCRLCGIKQVKPKLDIHHIEYNKRNNDLDKLISLCRSCHTKTNHNREKWIKFFNDVTKSNLKVSL